jgi:hypothetical protein
MLLPAGTVAAYGGGRTICPEQVTALAECLARVVLKC